MSATPFIQNLIFSKKELSGNKVMKGENVGRKVLDHACNHFKGGLSVKLHFFSQRRRGLGTKLGKKEILVG